MTPSRFNLGSTSKTLNLFLLRFNEQSGFENLAREVTCIINKWRAKINSKRIYNVRSPPGEGDRKRKKKNPGNEALKKEEELQTPLTRAEGSISHFSPRPYYSIHP